MIHTNIRVKPAYLFFALPVGAAFFLTALPDEIANKVQPISSPALFLLVSFLTCALTFIVIYLLSCRHVQGAAKPLLLPCIFLLLAGEGTFLLNSYSTINSIYLFIIAAILIGIGGSLLILLWSRAFCLIEPTELFTTLSLACACGGVLDILLRAFPLTIDATAIATGMVLISTLALERTIVNHEPAGINETIPSLNTTNASARADDKHGRISSMTAKRFIVTLWKPYCGVLLCLIIVACGWGTSLGTPDFSGTATYVILYMNAFSWQMTGFAIAGFLLCGLSLLLAERLDALKRCIHFTPVAAAALLLLAWLVILVDKSTFLLCATCLTGFAMGLLCIVALHTLITFSQDEQETFRFFSLAGALLFTVLVAFALIAYRLVNAAEYVTPILIVAYLALANFDFAQSTDRSSPVNTTTPSSSLDDTYEQRLVTVGEQYHLSPRELEILPLIAQGHSAHYVAEALCISFNTVKTHTRRVYDKLDVHTRDELITLINSTKL